MDKPLQPIQIKLALAWLTLALNCPYMVPSVRFELTLHGF